MTIVIWNIRGAIQGGFKIQIKDLINRYNSDIIILVETKVNSKREQQILTI